MRFFCLLLTIFALFSCNENKAYKTETLRFGVLKGPSALAFTGAMTEPYSEKLPVSVCFSIYTTPDMLIPLLVKGELDGCILPLNVAATLYNRSPELIKVWGICGNGMLSFVTSDPGINSFTDLKGKKISIGGMGSTPEYLFKYLLLKSGMEEDSVEVDYSLAPSGIVPALVSGLVDTALIPEPFTSLALEKGKKIRIPFSVKELFSGFSGIEDYPMTVVVFRSDFVEKNRALVKDFMEVWEDSLDWTLENPVSAAFKAEELGLGLTKEVAEKAIPKAGLVHIPAGNYASGKEGKKSIEYLLSLFHSFSPESVGGDLPDEEFYISF